MDKKMNCFNGMSTSPGHFYAVGVGPGSPDLLTVRAVELICSADVIIAPRSRIATESLALQTIKHLLDTQEVIEHVYAMTRDVESTMQSWETVADLVHQRCSEGQSVVQITIGDPLIYSTSHYLLSWLRSRMSDDTMHVVPGISAFQASASLFDQTLTIQEDRMTLMPATEISRVEEALDHCETLVLYKAGNKLSELSDLLERRGMLDRAKVVCYAEQSDRQFMSSDLRAAAEDPQGYMATVLINLGHTPWSPPESDEK